MADGRPADRLFSICHLRGNIALQIFELMNGYVTAGLPLDLRITAKPRGNEHLWALLQTLRDLLDQETLQPSMADDQPFLPYFSVGDDEPSSTA